MNDSYTKKMLKIIATCGVFVALTWGAMVSFISYQIIKSRFVEEKEGDDIRIKHLQQHHNEQVKFEQMIELLEEIKENTEEDRG